VAPPALTAPAPTRTMRHPILAAAGALLLLTPALPAQRVPAPRTMITLNPIAAVAGFLTGDIETRVNSAMTLGIGGSVGSTDDFNGYRSLEAKVRFYPNERALEGFAVTASAGVASSSDGFTSSVNGLISLQRATRGTYGTELSYQWLLGPKRRFAAVLGLGVKRIVGAETFIEPLNYDFIGTARANVGIGF
jgi:hypothetical protein